MPGFISPPVHRTEIGRGIYPGTNRGNRGYGRGGRDERKCDLHFLNSTYLGYVKNRDETARLGYLVFDTSGTTPILNAAAIAVAESLMTGKNEVFIDARTYTDAACNLCLASHIPLETWGICNNDTEAEIQGLNPYITGVSSNKWDAGKVLYDDAIGN